MPREATLYTAAPRLMGRIGSEEFFRRFALLLAAAAGAFAIVYVLFLTTEVDEFGRRQLADDELRLGCP